MTNRQCRQAELLRQHSSRADLVVVTLPLPKYHHLPVLHLTFYQTIILSMEGYQQVGPSTVPGWTFSLEISLLQCWSEGTNNLFWHSIHDDVLEQLLEFRKNKYEIKDNNYKCMNVTIQWTVSFWTPSNSFGQREPAICSYILFMITCMDKY